MSADLCQANRPSCLRLRWRGRQAPAPSVLGGKLTVSTGRIARNRAASCETFAIAAQTTCHRYSGDARGQLGRLADPRATTAQL